MSFERSVRPRSAGGLRTGAAHRRDGVELLRGGALPFGLLTFLIWLLALPFRLVGITLEGVFRLLAAIILLPARLIRGPRGARAA